MMINSINEWWISYALYKCTSTSITGKWADNIGTFYTKHMPTICRIITFELGFQHKLCSIDIIYIYMPKVTVLKVVSNSLTLQETWPWPSQPLMTSKIIDSPHSLTHWWSLTPSVPLPNPLWFSKEFKKLLAQGELTRK